MLLNHICSFWTDKEVAFELTKNPILDLKLEKGIVLVPVKLYFEMKELLHVIQIFLINVLFQINYRLQEEFH